MNRTPLLPERPRPLVFAHRGCSSLAPENTMAAFKKAREAGAPGIELDIHATRDGKLAVAHDDTFARTAPADFPRDSAGAAARLEDLAWAEIAAVDVGSFFGREWAAERPPPLEAVLEEFCPAMYIDIELKSRKTKDDPLPGLLARTLRAMGERVSGAVTVSSFNPFCLARFKEAWRAGGIPTAVIYTVDPEVPWLLRRGFGRVLSGCDYLKPAHVQAAPFALFRARLESRPVVPWTVDDPALAKSLAAAGCAGVITNRPQDIAGLWRV